jgi:DNA repair exonuclease SbcCD nuclease subunit
MKFVLISDFHIRTESPISRKDDIAVAAEQKLKFVCEYAYANNAEILSAGDLFDTPRSWRALNLVLRVFMNYPISVVGILGQHDKYMYSDDVTATSWGVLEQAGYINRPGQFYVYGASYGEQVPEVHKQDEGQRLLAIHKMILMKKMYKDQEALFAPAFLKDHPQFDLILCADAHQKFLYEKDGRFICNTGPILRLSADEADHKPGFFVYDSGSRDIEWVDIPHAPASEVISREHLDKALAINEMLDKFIGAVKEDVNVGLDFNANLDMFCRNNKISPAVMKILGRIMEAK